MDKMYDIRELFLFLSHTYVCALGIQSCMVSVMCYYDFNITRSDIQTSLLSSMELLMNILREISVTLPTFFQKQLVQLL